MPSNNNIHEAFILARTISENAHKILSKHESSKSRVILLEDTYNKLETLSIKQDDLLRQAMRCVDYELFRASHVMAWSAMADFIEEIIERDSFSSINKIRPKWNIGNKHDLRERFPESQIIDAMKDAKIISKNFSKALHGLLNKRNECAHPSDYYPDLNATLGYISEIIQRINMFSQNP
jgi:hypothetical protein